jgi:SHS2 domain-containing protein
MRTGFNILEHPADMGIEAHGNNLKEAFEQAAVGLIAIILDPSKIENIATKKVQIYASDYEQLLVKWLTEVLYLYDGENFATGKFEIETLTPKSVTAIINGEKFNNTKHTTKMDVKAITYHQILVQEKQDGGLIRVYLDI